MTADTVKVLSPVESPRLDVLDAGADGAARAVVWPGAGARQRAMHLLTLGAGCATRELRHPGEAVYYVIAGGGRVRDPQAGEDGDLTPGSMVHVEPGTPYAFLAGPDGIELVGGPGPVDPASYGPEA
jgi:quercetin dioxygenase-like cupin family protein